MIKLTGFEGQVEVGGNVLTTRFTGNVLTLIGLTMEQAHDVLAVLETGAVQADANKLPVAQSEMVVKTADGTGDKVKPVSDPPAAPTPPQSKPKRQRKAKKSAGKDDAAAKPPEETASASATPTTSDSKETPPYDSTQSIIPEAKPSNKQQSLPLEDDFADPTSGPQRSGNGASKTPAPVAEVPKAGSAEAPQRQDPSKLPPADDPLAPEGGVPEEIVTAVRLRQVLSYMLDHGMKKEDDIVSECVRIKADVPMLARINNLEERVRRTLSVMDVGGQFA